MKTKILLGKEYDSELRRALVDVFKAQGAESRSTRWGVAGSQECEFWSLELHGTEILVESETYFGLTIEGEQNVVERLARLIVQRKEAIELILKDSQPGYS